MEAPTGSTPAAPARAHRGREHRCDGDIPDHITPTNPTPDLTAMARAARAEWIGAAIRLGAARDPEARHEVRALRLWAREISLAAAAAGRDGAA